MSIKRDKYYIKLANNLALNLNGYSGPNPSVGTVIVKNDKILSFGSTGFSGRPHSEVNALNKLSKSEKKNSTIYISLEPCSHYGNTPPCTEIIIKKKIKKVIFSVFDIDIRSKKKSIYKLRNKNILVKNGTNSKYGKRFYESYYLNKKKLIQNHVYSENDDVLIKSFRNIKNSNIVSVSKLSTFDVISKDYIIFSMNGINDISKESK